MPGPGSVSPAHSLEEQDSDLPPRLGPSAHPENILVKELRNYDTECSDFFSLFDHISQQYYNKKNIKQLLILTSNIIYFFNSEFNVHNYLLFLSAHAQKCMNYIFSNHFI